MNNLTVPVLAALASSPVSLALLIARSRRSEATDRRAVDALARSVNLAVTEDVEPTLMITVRQQARHGLILLAILLPAIAAYCALVWHVFGAARASWPYWVLLGIALSLTPFLDQVVPRWPTPTRTSLAHAGRLRIRDYTDPVVLYALLVQWTALTISTAILCVAASRPQDRLRSFGVLLFIALVVGQYVLLGRRRLRQRARAATVQQLAFGDALASRALSKALGNMPFLGAVLVIAQVTPDHGWPISRLLGGCLISCAAVQLIAFARKLTGPQPLYERIRFPNAPTTPTAPNVLTRLRARRAS